MNINSKYRSIMMALIFTLAACRAPDNISEQTPFSIYECVSKEKRFDITDKLNEYSNSLKMKMNKVEITEGGPGSAFNFEREDLTITVVHQYNNDAITLVATKNTAANKNDISIVDSFLARLPAKDCRKRN